MIVSNGVAYVILWLAWTAGLSSRVDAWGAQDAGVKTLVLSHFVPLDDPDVTDSMWLVGKYLLEI